ncbi:MAG: ClC family H(+)/Cl(-) exchange transporter [Sutterellaceae bacterium]|nr:ClC family H(+)/Cl(-) exchange transporter [Sutterellaceae bacterium]MDD7441030.1 ClC family H(+)/Cl(-) exchange transporter [Sutterellaceae bacterium]MDY2867402.1 ClC family H(+)/Cl(-) exchange transporter [Mesosutterella sp.]
MEPKDQETGAKARRSAGTGRGKISDETFVQIRESQKLGALGLFAMILQAMAIGIVSGIVIGVFRAAFTVLNRIGTSWVLPQEAAGFGGGLSVLLALGACCLVAGTLLRIEPTISGSGIPQVELAQMGRFPPMNWLRVLVTKFIGTLTSLTAGLSVGREGPCVQMGAAVGIGVGTYFYGAEAQKMHRYLTGGAVSGMTAAFSSPIAGVLFAIEDMKVVLDRRMFTFLAVAAASAWLMVDKILGLPMVFPFSGLGFPDAGSAAALVPSAILCGAAGACYSKLLIGTTLFEDRVAWPSKWLRIGLPFALVALLLRVYPDVLTGIGPSPTGLQTAGLTVGALATLFAVKAAFSCLSFASGVAGGILMPILALGSILGSLAFGIGTAFGAASPALSGTFMVACMASFFAAVVRTPLTSAALLTEMTGAWALLPLTLASAAAGSLISKALGTEPVYDSLKNRILRQREKAEGHAWAPRN